MGINIGVYKIIGKTTFDNIFGELESPQYEVESQNWFDHLRHGYDAYFVIQNDWVAVDKDTDFPDYHRPENFEQCRKWVKDNVHQDNWKRLLDALDKLEADESLAFGWSW